MKQLFLILALALFSCNKKDDPKPETPKPTPTTSANTSFRFLARPGYFSAIKATWSNTEYSLGNYTGFGDPNPDTTITANINDQVLIYQFKSQQTSTLIIDSGHKKYTLVDSSATGTHTVTLW